MKKQIRARHSGFTLVEIMIVVAIIGLLSALALPSFVQARTASRIARVANDLRIFSSAFQQYVLQNGLYPVDTHIVLPPGMDEFIDEKHWNDCALGGSYNWEGPTWGEGGAYDYAGIALFDTPASASELLALDTKIDNGDLNTGAFRLMTGNGRYTYVIEE